MELVDISIIFKNKIKCSERNSRVVACEMWYEVVADCYLRLY